MIRIAITEAAFEAVAATLPLGSVGYEAQLDATRVGGSAARLPLDRDFLERASA